MSKGNDIVVFIPTRNSTCGECKQELGRGAWITLDRKKNAFCLNCADLDHLVFLPSGDAALTRRSRKYSGLSAVVVKWSRARKRYEYRGRVGRSAAAKALDEEAVRLAVTAHVRHAETNYDELLLKGIERRDARAKVYPKVSRVLNLWEHGGSQD
jgi:hypothetical protein